jgi:hypothetical protein
MAEKAERTGGRPFVFSMSNDQCVWSRAGVIKETKCINAFDCLGCTLDKQVIANYEKKRRMTGEQMIHSPRSALMMKQGKCRHMLSGRISYSLCSYGYNCVKCPYDQMLEDTGYLPNLKTPQCDNTSGFDVARDYYYFYGHTWARVEYGGRVRVGMDDFALRLFGRQDEIELPKLGADVEQGFYVQEIQRIIEQFDRHFSGVFIAGDGFGYGGDGRQFQPKIQWTDKLKTSNNRHTATAPGNDTNIQRQAMLVFFDDFHLGLPVSKI